jgi:CelD/BcsL family acetyltransferase involved in cellulose biosynthesis
MLESGRLRLHTLRLDGAPAAVTYCFAHHNRYFLYQHGFNERFRRHSVGLVALACTIRAAIEEGALEFDLLYGDEPYKSLWAQERRVLERIDLYPAGITGRIHQRTVEAKQSARLLARRALTRDMCNPDIHGAGVAS